MCGISEILADLKPSLVIEFGTRYGGSALFYATVMRQLGNPFRIFSVDVSLKVLDQSARREPDITFVESSSTDPAVADQIRSLKEDYPGKIIVILDSDHSMHHVLG